MSQSNIIFGTLLFAFIIYITTKGELPAYIGLFTKKGTSASVGTDTSGSASVFGVPGTSTHSLPTNTSNATQNIFNGISNIKVAPSGFNPSWGQALSSFFK